jgi:hypothetical protein
LEEVSAVGIGAHPFNAAGLVLHGILGFFDSLVDLFTGLFHGPLGIYRVLQEYARVSLALQHE